MFFLFFFFFYFILNSVYNGNVANVIVASGLQCEKQKCEQLFASSSICSNRNYLSHIILQCDNQKCFFCEFLTSSSVNLKTCTVVATLMCGLCSTTCEWTLAFPPWWFPWVVNKADVFCISFLFNKHLRFYVQS